MEIYFEITTPLNIRVRTTTEYWQYLIDTKHPIMHNKDELVKKILSEPDEIRQSRIDKEAFLYYGKFDKLYCVVVKHLGNEGFLITAYPTDRVKEGEVIWQK
jgi:hypothetical protein